VIPTVEQCIRLSPRDPYSGNWYYRIGCVHLLEMRVDEAIGWLEKARDFSPDSPLHHAYLAAAYALKGEADRAAAELAEAQRLSRDGRYSSIAGLKELEYFGTGAFRPRYESTCLAALQKAGMPEVELRAPRRLWNGVISAASWLTWPQLGAGDEIWDFYELQLPRPWKPDNEFTLSTTRSTSSNWRTDSATTSPGTGRGQT
jgi:tetratricopeptide (TPR) repeat protein